MRAENRSADKRRTDGEILMTDSFLPLIFCEAIVPRALTGALRYKRGVNTDSARQTKTFFVPRCFSDFFFFFFSCRVLIQFPARQERASLSLTVYTCKSAGGLLFAGDPPLGDI